MRVVSALFEWAKFLLRPHVNYFTAVLRFPGAIVYPTANITQDCVIKGPVTVFQSAVLSNTKINEYSYVGLNSRLKNCTVGKFCSIGQNVQVGLGVHPTNYVSTYPGFYSTRASVPVTLSTTDRTTEHEHVCIGHDVWIGNNAILLDGVNIGNGAVIGANAVVTRDVPPFAIVAGCPAKLIRFRFKQEVIDFLQTFEWWYKDISFLRENCDLMESEAAFLKAFQGKSALDENPNVKPV